MTCGHIFKIAKSDLSASPCPPACRHGTNRLPQDGLPQNFIFEYFLKICQEHSSLVNPYPASVENMVSK